MLVPHILGSAPVASRNISAIVRLSWRFFSSGMAARKSATLTSVGLVFSSAKGRSWGRGNGPTGELYRRGSLAGLSSDERAAIDGPPGPVYPSWPQADHTVSGRERWVE